MKRLYLLLSLVALHLNMNAQLGYYYDSEFIELIPGKDSLNYIEFKEYQREDINTSIRNHELNVFYTISENQIVVKGLANTNKEWYISPLYTNPYRYGNVIVLPEIILSTKDNEVVKHILTKYKEKMSLESVVHGKKYKLSCNTKSSEEVLKLVGIISKMDGIDWCEPNMISNI